MSFSSDIKDELAGQFSKARHCQLAELAALIGSCGEWNEIDGKISIEIQTENAAVVRKCFTLLEKTFNIGNDIFAEVAVGYGSQRDNGIYILNAEGEGLRAILNASVQSVCCKRAFLRGTFIATGSISDPSKSYHFEIVCYTMENAQYLRYLMNSFQLDAKIVQRKNTYVVYLKEGAQIVDMLNVMEAHVALMELENVRILKEMRNAVNRKVNCETANINKTVSAAVKQREDIEFIRDHLGFDKLPEGLKDVALTRLEYPEVTIKELGTLLQIPVGKSGVNHRLRKLSEMAEKLRAQLGGTL